MTRSSNAIPEWLLAQRSRGWDVMDIHGPMKAFIAGEREREPDFRLAGDGVHANATGHAIIAREILSAWKFPRLEVTAGPGVERAFAPDPKGLEVLRLVQKKQRLLKDAWLTEHGASTARDEAGPAPGGGRTAGGPAGGRDRRAVEARAS